MISLTSKPPNTNINKMSSNKTNKKSMKSKKELVIVNDTKSVEQSEIEIEK